jgi:hypothetical protein
MMDDGAEMKSAACALTIDAAPMKWGAIDQNLRDLACIGAILTLLANSIDDSFANADSDDRKRDHVEEDIKMASEYLGAAVDRHVCEILHLRDVEGV